jgi:hypothetical protein
VVVGYVQGVLLLADAAGVPEVPAITTLEVASIVIAIADSIITKETAIAITIFLSFLFFKTFTSYFLTRVD